MKLQSIYNTQKLRLISFSGDNPFGGKNIWQQSHKSLRLKLVCCRLYPALTDLRSRIFFVLTGDYVQNYLEYYPDLKNATMFVSEPYNSKFCFELFQLDPSQGNTVAWHLFREDNGLLVNKVKSVRSCAHTLTYTLDCNVLCVCCHRIGTPLVLCWVMQLLPEKWLCMCIFIKNIFRRLSASYSVYRPYNHSTTRAVDNICSLVQLTQTTQHLLFLWTSWARCQEPTHPVSTPQHPGLHPKTLLMQSQRQWDRATWCVPAQIGR